MDPNRITYFGETDFRNQKTRFGIKAIDRTKHVYVIGKSGMGKSTLLENMAVQDIVNGEGIAIIDPHGGTAEKLLHYVPDSRINDVIYFAPFDLEYPIALNVMEDVGPDKRHLVASGLMSAFKKIWVDAWSARMEYILNNTILALLEYPDATLLSINKMLSDKDFRKDVLSHVTDLSVKSFWVDEFAKYTERMAQEAVPAIQNKVGQFTANPVIRNIVGSPKSSFDFRQAMDTKKIVIINLSKGRLGEQNASLLGALIITKIYLAAMSRADASETIARDLPSFNFFVDEFQSFASDSFADILSEARKYKLCLHLAHQYIEQMSEQVKAAVLGNVGTMIVFRVGSTDALVFEKEFAPTFTAEDIVNLDFAQMYLRMTIDGIGSKPFSAKGLGPIAPPDYSNKDQVIEASRKNYARPRAEIEEVVRKLLEAAPVVSKKAEAPQTSSYNERQDSKMRQAFNNVVKPVNNPAPKTFEKPIEPKRGLFAKLEEEVKKESEAVIALEKTYDNSFSTKFNTQNNANTNIKPAPQIIPKKVPATAPVVAPKPVTVSIDRPVNNSFNQKPKVHSYADKGAKPESISALKDFLNQVVGNNQNVKTDTVVQPKPEIKIEEKIESKPEVKTGVKKDDPVPEPVIARTDNTHSVKEVPEDVLKRILNQD